MDNSLALLSPAKLNLFLHINSRRPDGYHELQTVFQILDYGDQMQFTPNTSGEITLSPEMDGVKLEENLIYKAASMLKEHALPQVGVDIHIEKILPMGGGIGGGSSNAATTLIALNKLWAANLSIEQLADMGRSLGADVPVFVRGNSAFAEGVGEQISPVELAENWFVVLCPNCHVSTAQIFSNERLTRDTPKMKIAPASEGQDFSTLSNDCESIVCELYPEIREAIEWLNQFGQGRLTGTGACCFLQVSSEEEAKQVLNEARSKFKGFLAKGVNLSPAHQRLNEAD